MKRKEQYVNSNHTKDESINVNVIANFYGWDIYDTLLMIDRSRYDGSNSGFWIQLAHTIYIPIMTTFCYILYRKLRYVQVGWF